MANRQPLTGKALTQADAKTVADITVSDKWIEATTEAWADRELTWENVIRFIAERQATIEDNLIRQGRERGYCNEYNKHANLAIPLPVNGHKVTTFGGLNCNNVLVVGIDPDGYDVDGFHSETGRCRKGFDRDGYNEAGFHVSGYHRETGLTWDGRDFDGFYVATGVDQYGQRDSRSAKQKAAAITSGKEYGKQYGTYTPSF